MVIARSTGARLHSSRPAESRDTDCMSIETAMRQAAEAGWDALEWHDDIDIKIDPGDTLAAYVWGISADGGAGHGLPLAAVLLDPSFWRALGRAKGWGESGWRQHWHRLVDDLADDRSVEDFFSRLDG